jgi:hypothetical protein
VWYTRTRLLTLAWGHHTRFSINQLHDALTQLTPTSGMSAYIHRDEQPHADPHSDCHNVLPLDDNALRFPHVLVAASQQLPGLFRITNTSFHAPPPNTPPIRALTTITGDAPRPLFACDAADSSDGICLHSARHAMTYDNGEPFRGVAPTITLAKATRLPAMAPESPVNAHPTTMKFRHEQTTTSRP